MKGKHIVAVSGGKDSTALALRLAEVSPDIDYTYICTPTGDELPEVIEHWKYLEELLGKSIIELKAKHDLNGLIDEIGGLPNHQYRWCTRILKIEPCIAYYKANPGSVVYVGLRSDEPDRIGGIYGDLVEQKYPLRDWGWGIEEVWDYLNTKDIKIPARTDCARCFHQRLKEWHSLWETHPEIYQDAVQQEQRYDMTFRRGDRDSFPAALVDMREEFKKGRKPRKYVMKNDICRACSL